MKFTRRSRILAVVCIALLLAIIVPMALYGADGLQTFYGVKIGSLKGGFDRFTLEGNRGVMTAKTTTTTQNAWFINYSALTTGNGMVLYADTDIVTTGKVFNVMTGATTATATTKFNIDEDGDTTIAGTLAAGATTITGNSSVTGTFGVTGVSTLTGNVNVTGALAATGVVTGLMSVDTTSLSDGAHTFAVADSGKFFVGRAGTNTLTLPTPAAGNTGCYGWIIQSSAANMVITGDADKLFAFGGDGTSQTATWSTGGEQLGAAAFFISTGSQWIVIPTSDSCTATIS